MLNSKQVVVGIKESYAFTDYTVIVNKNTIIRLKLYNTDNLFTNEHSKPVQPIFKNIR